MEYVNRSFNGTLTTVLTQLCGTNDFYTIDTMLLSVLSITIPASLIVNGLVIVVFIRCKDLRSPVFYFALNMSISDIFIPLLRLLFMVFFRSPMYHLQLSDSIALVFCKLSPYLESVSVAVSMQSIVAITLHRFFAVVFPLNARLESSKICAFIICVVWCVALLSQIPEVILREISQPVGLCIYTLTADQLKQYFSLRMAAFCLLPLLLMVLLYGFIIFRLRKPNLPGDASFEQKEKRRKRNKKLTKVLLAIIAAFFICWGTFDVLRWAFLFHPNCSLFLALFYAEPLPLIYSAANALILFTFSTTYRRALTRVLPDMLSTRRIHATSRDT